MDVQVFKRWASMFFNVKHGRSNVIRPYFFQCKTWIFECYSKIEFCWRDKQFEWNGFGSFQEGPSVREEHSWAELLESMLDFLSNHE